jgi:hypothetical protein
MYLLPLRPHLTKLLSPDSEELKLCQTGPNNCEEVQQMQSQTRNNSETVAGTSSGGGIMPRRSVPGAEHSALDRLPSAWPQSAAAAPNNVPSPVSTWATSGDNPAPESGQDTNPESAPELAESSLANGAGSSAASGSVTTTAPTPSYSVNTRPRTRLQGGI